MKIIKIEGTKAVVESAGHSHTVDISLLKEPKVGEYVLAHGEMAINKLPAEEAEKILSIVNSQEKAH